MKKLLTLCATTALMLTPLALSAGGPPVATVGVDTSPSVYTKTATKGTANLGEAVANNKFVDVECDNDDPIVGCGFQLGGSNAGGVLSATNQQLADHITMLESRPLGGASKCRARAHETPVNGITQEVGWKITAWAICLKVDSTVSTVLVNGEPGQ